jgi:hypothetical protein
LLSLFAATVTLALFQWESRNIDICWWLALRIGALEQRLLENIPQDEKLSKTLSELRPRLGIDKPQVEAFVYGATIVAWLTVPWLHSRPPANLYWVAVIATALLGLAALVSIGEILRYHHWPSHGDLEHPTKSAPADHR